MKARQRGAQHAGGRGRQRGIGDSTKKAAVGFCFGGGNILEHDFIQDAFNKKL
jgi:hypothetical protein